MTFNIPCYEVGESKDNKSCETTILETFYDEKDAIKYIVELYINDLLKDNNFYNTECKYYYRKKYCSHSVNKYQALYNYMYSEWTSYNINELQNYCKVNDKEEIKKYFYEYNVWVSKNLSLLKFCNEDLCGYSTTNYFNMSKHLLKVHKKEPVRELHEELHQTD